MEKCGEPFGASVLFVPLGVLASVPWRAAPAQRNAYASAAFASLPLALLVARLGCVWAGCCHGIATELPWGIPAWSGGAPLHPTALYEAAGLLLLATGLRRVPDAQVAPVVFSALGLLRLALEPLRADPPFGPPVLPVTVLAASLAALGGVWFVVERSRAQRSRHEPARSASAPAIAPQRSAS